MEIFIAIAVLSILILVHELGHFITARRSGMLVEEFGFGLPPRLWSKRVGETIYSVNALPFGGFVKIYGESGPVETPRPEHEGRAFYLKPVSTRFLVLVAGVVMNFLLGVLLFSVLYTAGVPTAATDRNRATLQDLHVEIIEVAKNSPASIAGLMIGDGVRELSFRSEVLRVKSVPEIQNFVTKYGGKEIQLKVARDGNLIALKLIPRTNPPSGEGPLGIALAEVGILKYPWYRSIWEGFNTSFDIAQKVVAALGRIVKDLVSQGKVTEGVAGPIGIVGVAGEAARLGITRLILFAALITINLSVLNFLPIPALDGGRILFLVLEKIRGKPISRRFETATHAIGMAILLTLIILISIQDIRRLF